MRLLMRHFIVTSLIFLFVAAAATTSDAATIGFSVRADTGDRLFAVDLETGRAIDYGQLMFGPEGLAFIGNQLYAVDGDLGATDQLWNITPPAGTPPFWPPTGTPVGPLGYRLGFDAGLGATADGVLYNLQGYAAGDDSQSFLYRVSTTTGAATLIGGSRIYADGLAINQSGAFAVDGKFTDSLYRVDLLTGALTLVGSLGLGNTLLHVGLDFDQNGTLWMLATGISAAPSQIYRIDTSTGKATFVAPVTQVVYGDVYTLNGFQSLAIQGGSNSGGQLGGAVVAVATPEPGTLMMMTLGVGWLARGRRSRSQTAPTLPRARG